MIKWKRISAGKGECKLTRICIVEDDESIRQLLKLTLENFQYEIVDFDNGADAHEYLLDHKVDLAILRFDVAAHEWI